MQTYDVAISYASEDLDRAAELSEALSSAGFKVFFDQDIEAKIESWGKGQQKNLRNIYKSAKCCVVLLSNNYFISPWTKLELRSAQNALPVVVGPLREKLRLPRHDVSWPSNGATELVEQIRQKLEQLELEKQERKRERSAMLLKGLGAVFTAAIGVAATAAANQKTQQRLEENTGSIDGHWVDMTGVAWEITQEGDRISLSGKAPNGIEIRAHGSRHGRDISAEWSSPIGQGAIKAAISSGGKIIQGYATGPHGAFPLNLSR